MLYRLLADGSPHSLEVNGNSYLFQFQGQRAGASDWLEVTAESGESQK